MPRRKEPKRAPKGSIDTAVLVRMDAELRALARSAAKSAGISETEWWREAGRAKLVGQYVTPPPFEEG